MKPLRSSSLLAASALLAALGALSSTSRSTNTGFVATLAGTAAGVGSADATGASARFHNPIGIAVDATGNVYVADQSNHTIRKTTAAGATTTLAGLALSPGTADGMGTAARFKYPYGVALDGAGVLYVSDQYNHTIRKITPAGLVTTLAGLPGYHGSADGTGTAARFHNPAGVAVDAAGNVYVADQSNHAIRKITPAGLVTTLAGQAFQPGSADGTGSTARFENPAGVAVDAAGNVYVADQDNRTIRKITPAGAVTRVAGQTGLSGSRDTVALRARFNFPTGVAVDAAGTLYVADRFNHTIRVVPTAGMVSTLAGSPQQMGSSNGTGSAAHFNCPMGVAVDGSGAVYVADQSNHTVRVIR
jgi:sugar lactone lactonase YvrE